MENGARERRAVLVTGCSSGIGRAIAIRLAKGGFTLFATVRKEEDRRSLEALGLPRLNVICPLDLAREEEILSAVSGLARSLGEQRVELFAVVNNAGGGAPAPVELLAPQLLRTELSARIAGPVSLLQATLPMLRQAGGRILWITTPAIIPTPYVASIHACDFAVNCLSRTLDIELSPWKIPVVMVRCGGVATRAGLRTTEDVQKLLGSLSPDRRRLYGAALEQWAEEMKEFDERRIPPEEVAEVVYRALAARRPRRRYSVGYLARLAVLLEALPQSLGDRILRRRFRAEPSASRLSEGEAPLTDRR